MSLRDDLIAARALIDTPEKWCRDRGHAVAYKWFGLREVHSYCIIAALHIGIPDREASYRAEAALRADTPWLVNFNGKPTTTHADIMALFDRAIAAAEPANV